MPIASKASIPFIARDDEDEPCDRCVRKCAAWATFELPAGVMTATDAVDNWRMEVSPFPNH